MDDQNKSMKKRWAEPGGTFERGLADDEESPERRTTEIRAEIEQTRADMGETIDAIQNRLRPGNVMSMAAETVKEKTIDRVKQAASSVRETLSIGSHRTNATVGNALADHIRENPIQAALAVASLAWLALSPRDVHEKQGRSTNRQHNESSYGPMLAEDRYPSTDAHTDVTTRMHRAMSHARNGVNRLISDNPLAAAGVAMTVGLAIGLALPETEDENALMGQRRDEVGGRVKDAVRGAAERVEDAVQQVREIAGQVVAGTETRQE